MAALKSLIGRAHSWAALGWNRGVLSDMGVGSDMWCFSEGETSPSLADVCRKSGKCDQECQRHVLQTPARKRSGRLRRDVSTKLPRLAASFASNRRFPIFVSPRTRKKKELPRRQLEEKYSSSIADTALKSLNNLFLPTLVHVIASQREQLQHQKLQLLPACLDLFRIASLHHRC